MSTTVGRERGVAAVIGNTPLVEIVNLNPYPGVRILAKLEGSNPGGSVKDRAAQFMIRKAEESGELTPQKTIVEATSGNMGIALAMIGAVKGYKVKLFMPECVSSERRKVLEAFGADLVLTPAKEVTDGAIRRDNLWTRTRIIITCLTSSAMWAMCWLTTTQPALKSGLSLTARWICSWPEWAPPEL
jgi:cysteine synthase